MKFYLFSALIIIAFYSACKKDDNATPTASSQADSVSNASSDNLPVAQYIGTWLDSATFGGACGAPQGTEYDTNLSFVYCVTNVKNDSLIFWMQNPLWFSGFGYAIQIGGEFQINTQNDYTYNPPYTPVFKIIKDSLYVYGSYSGYDIGNDYYGNTTFTFAGKLQPFDTATVQAKQRKL